MFYELSDRVATNVAGFLSVKELYRLLLLSPRAQVSCWASEEVWRSRALQEYPELSDFQPSPPLLTPNFADGKPRVEASSPAALFKRRATGVDLQQADAPGHAYRLGSSGITETKSDPAEDPARSPAADLSEAPTVLQSRSKSSEAHSVFSHPPSELNSDELSALRFHYADLKSFALPSAPSNKPSDMRSSSLSGPESRDATERPLESSGSPRKADSDEDLEVSDRERKSPEPIVATIASTDSAATPEARPPASSVQSAILTFYRAATANLQRSQLHDFADPRDAARFQSLCSGYVWRKLLISHAEKEIPSSLLRSRAAFALLRDRILAASPRPLSKAQTLRALRLCGAFAGMSFAPFVVDRWLRLADTEYKQRAGDGKFSGLHDWLPPFESLYPVYNSSLHGMTAASLRRRMAYMGERHSPCLILITTGATPSTATASMTTTPTSDSPHSSPPPTTTAPLTSTTPSPAQRPSLPDSQGGNSNASGGDPSSHSSSSSNATSAVAVWLSGGLETEHSQGVVLISSQGAFRPRVIVREDPVWKGDPATALGATWCIDGSLSFALEAVALDSELQTLTLRARLLEFGLPAHLLAPTAGLPTTLSPAGSFASANSALATVGSLTAAAPYAEFPIGSVQVWVPWWTRHPRFEPRCAAARRVNRTLANKDPLNDTRIGRLLQGNAALLSYLRANLPPPTAGEKPSSYWHEDSPSESEAEGDVSVDAGGAAAAGVRHEERVDSADELLTSVQAQRQRELRFLLHYGREYRVSDYFPAAPRRLSIAEELLPGVRHRRAT